jgi:hypothetical protein
MLKSTGKYAAIFCVTALTVLLFAGAAAQAATPHAAAAAATAAAAAAPSLTHQASPARKVVFQFGNRATVEVPEPGSLALLTVGGVLFVCRRRRR